MNIIIVKTKSGLFRAAVGPVTQEAGQAVADAVAKAGMVYEVYPATDAAIFLSKFGE